jgi:hypothetical protein
VGLEVIEGEGEKGKEIRKGFRKVFALRNQTLQW